MVSEGLPGEPLVEWLRMNYGNVEVEVLGTDPRTMYDIRFNPFSIGSKTTSHTTADHVFDVKMAVPRTWVLSSRLGRCSEYSMAMYHIMRALKYPTRPSLGGGEATALRACLCLPDVDRKILVQGGWIHIDPCEAAFDDKSMYFSWGKNHTYIFAFSKYVACMHSVPAHPQARTMVTPCLATVVWT
eukprot:750756-Hanusia_phi.AAC.5